MGIAAHPHPRYLDFSIRYSQLTIIDSFFSPNSIHPIS